MLSLYEVNVHISILQMTKMRLGEMKGLPKASQEASRRARYQTHAQTRTASREQVLASALCPAGHLTVPPPYRTEQHKPR